MSPVRLSVRNLAKHVTDSKLKAMAVAAARTGIEAGRAAPQDVRRYLEAQVRSLHMRYLGSIKGYTEFITYHSHALSTTAILMFFYLPTFNLRLVKPYDSFLTLMYMEKLEIPMGTGVRQLPSPLPPTRSV